MSYALNAQVAVTTKRSMPPLAVVAEDPMMAIGSVARFARNETIFNEGDAAEFSYKVVSGAVRLSKVMLDGRRQIADFALAADIFGLDWPDNYAVTAEALTEVTVIRYGRSSLQRLGDQRIEVRSKLADVLRRDLWAAQNHLVMLGCQTARERVASFLLLFVKRSNAKNGQAFELPMGRQDVADYLGLTIETVCRTLSDLKAQGLIETPKRHEVLVHSISTLRAIAQGDSDN
jgi:CRP/FNR family nitrogen fixation transcriptional regulator